MTKRAGAALLLIGAALFIIANRAAYKSYFQDDELDNISWTRDIAVSGYVKAVLTPRFYENNFRPVPHFYFRQMSLCYGLDFPKYLPILHLIHMFNVWLVWTLARQLKATPLAASAGALLFAFHMAVFDVYWKPMYVFDLFCAAFSLGSILLWSRRRYVLSFCSFWLAYKSKELAVMLPVVLACYELWFAEKKTWKALIPFFAASLSFGLQGILLNPNVDNMYTFRFTLNAFWTCLTYYSSQVLLAPYAGLGLLALPFAVRDRRMWFGCAAMCLFFTPLLFLPGRLFGAYCYLPLAGTALMISALASRTNFQVIAFGAALWIFANEAQFRMKRREALALAAENRVYVTTLTDFARSSKDTRTFVYDGAPAAMHTWGIAGALRFLFHRQPELYAVDDKAAAELLLKPEVAVLKWEPSEQSLGIVASGFATPMRRFEEGWFQKENGFRWIAPHAVAKLTPPAGANDFEIVVNVPALQLSSTGPIELAVSLNGAEARKRRFTEMGVHTWRWPATLTGTGPVSVVIDVKPEFRPQNGDTRVLGLAVQEIGFK